MWRTFTSQPGPGVGLDHHELVDVVAVERVGAGADHRAGDRRADLPTGLDDDVGGAPGGRCPGRVTPS